MKLNLLLILVICPVWVFAQKSLLVSGQIMDKSTAEALPFATIALLDSGKKLISGTTTNEAGGFQIALARTDTFYVKVQYIGFQSLDTLFTVKEDRSALNLMLLLAPNANQLSEVVVRSEKSVGSFQMDKQTFNVAKLGNTTSGTGLDVLQRLPSVTINAEGKILMRGNAEFLVTINGKFTNQTAADVLAQLPANTIEAIEIITSPSASQDAEGKAGIINIITKQTLADGWGITANVNASGKARFGGDFTYFQTRKRFNSFFTANLRRYDIGGYRLGEIRTLYQDTITYLPSGGDRPTAETIYGIRAGTTFNVSKSVTLNSGIYYGYKQNDRIAKLNYRQFSSAAQPLNLYQKFDDQTLERSFYNENLFVRTGQFFTTNTDFSKVFKDHSKIALAAIYEYSILGGPLRNEDHTAANEQVILQERSDERSPLNAWRLQADFTRNLSKNLVFETGYQWRTIHHTGDFDFGRLDLASSVWETDAAFEDSLDLRQTVHAGYLQVSGQHKRLQFRGGLRGEQMFRDLIHQRGTNQLRQFDFFPSFQSLWKIKDMREIKVGYSKRIDRPTTKALSPFKNHRHSEAIWIGDPNLLPEITHSFEAAFTQKFEKGRFAVTAYHNRTSNLIFRVNDEYSRITLLTTYTNAGNSRSTGMEAVAEWDAKQWWRLYFSGNAYLFQLRDIENTARDRAQSINFNLNANTSFRLSQKWRIQWNATYLSRTVTAQGNDTDMLLSNIGLKFSISKKWTANLLFQNIFDDNRQRITTQDDNFFSSTEYSKYDRLLQLTLGYRFNENGKSTKFIKTEYGEKDF